MNYRCVVMVFPIKLSTVESQNNVLVCYFIQEQDQVIIILCQRTIVCQQIKKFNFVCASILVLSSSLGKE